MINEFITGGITSILIGLVSILFSFFEQIQLLDTAFADFLNVSGIIIIIFSLVLIVFGLILPQKIIEKS